MEQRLHVNGRKKRVKISYANHVLGHHIYSKLEFLSCMNIIIWFRISRPTSVQFFYFRSAMPCFAKNLPKQLCTQLLPAYICRTLTSQKLKNIPKIWLTTPKNIQYMDGQTTTDVVRSQQSFDHRRDYEKLNTLNINTGNNQQIKLKLWYRSNC